MQPALAELNRLPSGSDTVDPRRTPKPLTAPGLTEQELVREFTDTRAASREEARNDDRARRPFGRGWVFWCVLDVSLIALPVPLVVAVPPIMHCRHVEKNVGFYSGESFSGCAVDGIKERWTLLDSRMKMLIRNSGR